MLLIDGETITLATASVAPISRPPTSAPAMEPRPPTMTMVKASRVSDGPSIGVMSVTAIMIEPAAPTQASPMPNEIAYSRFTSSPTTPAPTMLSAAARIAVPVEV